MHSPQTHHLLSLLAATIFADKRVFASEVECFVETARNLPILHVIESNLSQLSLLEWYETHKDTIRAKVDHVYFKDWFYETLDALSSIDNKIPILNAMRAISLADGEVHVSERALLMLAARHWGIEVK